MSADTAERPARAEPSGWPNLGILGAGRLGSALALALLGRGLPRDSLSLATRGGEESRARLDAAGLSGLLVPRAALLRAEGIVVAVRPQSIRELGTLELRDGSWAALCVAGLRASAAMRIAGAGAARMMTSGPDTILEGRGVAAVCPSSAPVATILERIGLATARVDDDSLVDAFTAAVCMPAAVALAEGPVSLELEALASEMPQLAEVFRWIPGVLPDFASGTERVAYVDRMVTPGGVTEAVVSAIGAGRGIRDSFYAGLRRAEELGAALSKP